jgi:integrase
VRAAAMFTPDQSVRRVVLDFYLPSNIAIRDPKTRVNYLRACDDLAEFLGRESVLSDLTDETLARFLIWLLDGSQRRRGKLAETTANERFGRIRAFWTWAARKRYVDQFPTVRCVAEPERIPRAWREDELVKLFNACRRQRGDIAGIPAWRWWVTLHGWLWCTSERIGATLRLRVSDLRLDDLLAVVPAQIRKGKREPRVYAIWPDLAEMLRMILPPHGPERELVWPWPRKQSTLYHHYGKLLKMAGLPNDRYAKPHAMRVSHASWRERIGEDAGRALGHKDAASTRRYIDPTLLKQDESKLFRPW